MDSYQREFIDFMVRSDVLTFGDFVTKSGRKTPFFINTGRYSTGEQMARLGEFYASSILENVGENFDVLFGPAYKGIPLVIATAMALDKRGVSTKFCFNRKEAKDHGEGGVLVGHTPQDGERVLYVEDVTTAGTSVRETVPILRAAADVRLAGLAVSVDRMERSGREGSSDSALKELSEEFAMPTFAIVTVEQIMADLGGRSVDGRVVLTDDLLERMREYRAAFGAA